MVDFKEDILNFQRVASALGYYAGKLDGKWGPATERAYQQFSDESDRIAKTKGRFDLRTEQNITTLIPPAQSLARWMVKTARKGGFNVRIISGTRSYAEQNKLYWKGRTPQSIWRGEQVVTQARAGYSNHNFLLAWDVGIFGANGEYVEDDSRYWALARYIRSMAARESITNLDLGAFWAGRFADVSHYGFKSQYANRYGSPTNDLRVRFQSGRRYW